MADKADTVRKTVIYLRLAAAQMRWMAETFGDADLKRELRHIAEQCDVQAKDLATDFDLPELLPG